MRTGPSVATGPAGGGGRTDPPCEAPADAALDADTRTTRYVSAGLVGDRAATR